MTLITALKWVTDQYVTEKGRLKGFRIAGTVLLSIFFKYSPGFVEIIDHHSFVYCFI